MPSRRVLAAIVVIAGLLVGGWLWFRDSSLVAVKRVTITGVRGPDSPRIRSALQAAARNMTTLDVQMDQLKTAVAPFPIVRSLSVSSQFPHGIRIRVIEQVPVGAVSFGGRLQAVAADGTILRDFPAARSLPVIPLRLAPGGSRLTDPHALGAVAVLAAAPDQLRSGVTEVTWTSSHGLVAQLRNGPSIYFGDTMRLDAKWSSAAAVLADPGSAGAVYLDVTDPEHPAAGAGTGSAATGSSGASVVSVTTGTSSSATASTGAAATAGTGAAATAGTGAAATAGTGAAAPAAATATSGTAPATTGGTAAATTSGTVSGGASGTAGNGATPSGTADGAAATPGG